MERVIVSAKVTPEIKRMIKKVARRLRITTSRYIETVLNERMGYIKRRGGVK